MLSLITEILLLVKANGHMLHEADVTCILPHLIDKSGHKSERQKIAFKTALSTAALVIIPSRLCHQLLQGLTCKNTKSRVVCIEEIQGAVERSGAVSLGKLGIKEVRQAGWIQLYMMNYLSAYYLYVLLLFACLQICFNGLLFYTVENCTTHPSLSFSLLSPNFYQSLFISAFYYMLISIYYLQIAKYLDSKDTDVSGRNACLDLCYALYLSFGKFKCIYYITLITIRYKQS